MKKLWQKIKCLLGLHELDVVKDYYTDTSFHILYECRHCHKTLDIDIPRKNLIPDYLDKK